VHQSGELEKLLSDSNVIPKADGEAAEKEVAT
jgi:hypothetical protein